MTHVVAVDLVQPQSILSALAAELELVAARLGCGAVRSIVHGGGPTLLEHLQTTGHATEGILLMKALL